VGKHAICHISQTIKAPFYTHFLHCVLGGKRDIRDVSKGPIPYGRLCFLDEITLLVSQDAFWELWKRSLFGYWRIQKSFFRGQWRLLSDVRFFTLNPLGKSDLERLIQQALTQESGLESVTVESRNRPCLEFWEGMVETLDSSKIVM